MKKNKILTVYSIFVSLVFAFAVAFFAINIFKEYKGGYLRTRKSFEALTASVKITAQIENSSSPDYPSKIAASVGKLDDYNYLEIKQNGNTLYLYSPKGIAPKENTNMIKLFFNTTKVGNETLYVNAAMYTLRPLTIAKYAKLSFLIIMIFTVLTILLIVYITIFVQNSSTSEISIDEENSDSLQENDSDKKIFDEGENKSEEELNSAQDNNSENEIISDNIIDNNTDIEKDEIDINENTEEIDNNVYTEAINIPVADDLPGEIKEYEIDPQGLFNPESGFGWESYLLTRLENELVRATSSEFDLILFIIKITGIEKDSKVMQNVSDALINTFQFKDLIFEYKEDGFAAIKTNCNIDEAIPLADKLHTEISTAIKDEGGKCFIGMSSRTIRLVSGERLLKEADSALNHALEDETAPIIAFRANTERYLNFVDNNR